MSLLGFGQVHGLPYVLPNPDGTIDSNDRAQLIHLYPGISIVSGQPTMRRWGGVPHVRPTTPAFGRSW